MHLIIIGVEHTMQDSEELRDVLAALTDPELVTLIGEERPFGQGVAAEVAQSKNIRWLQIDMTTEDRIHAGIYDKLSGRMLHWPVDENGIPIETLCYAMKEDGIREWFWLDRIVEHYTHGTVVVVCGPGHVRPLSDKGISRGHDTRLMFLPENPGSQFWVSIQPKLF